MAIVNQGIKGSNYTEEINPLDPDVDGLLVIKDINGANPQSRKTLLQNIIASILGDIQSEFMDDGSYTPSLTGMTIGSGGGAANDADWTYVGGLISITGYIEFGTSGQTFPASTIGISPPPTYEFAHISTNAPLGVCTLVNNTTSNPGQCWYDSSNVIRFVPMNASGSYPVLIATSTTVPFTWGAGDSIRYGFTTRAVRT